MNAAMAAWFRLSPWGSKGTPNPFVRCRHSIRGAVGRLIGRTDEPSGPRDRRASVNGGANRGNHERRKTDDYRSRRCSRRQQKLSSRSRFARFAGLGRSSHGHLVGLVQHGWSGILTSADPAHAAGPDSSSDSGAGFLPASRCSSISTRRTR